LLDAAKLKSLEGIENLPTIERLDISGTKITDLELIPRLGNLQQLFLSSEQVTSIPKWMKLKKLSIRGKTLASLRPVQDFGESLTELVMNVESVSDWTSLGQLSNLETLILSNNSVPPAATLAALSKLKNLNLRNPGRIDLRKLATLKQQLTIELPEESQKLVQLPKGNNIVVKLTCGVGPCSPVPWPKSFEREF
jgi:internalin A